MENSSFGRLISVLISPGKTFESIAARPTIAVVLIFGILLGAGANFLVMSKVDGEEMARSQIERSGREVSEAEMERAIAISSNLKYIGPIASTVFMPIFYLVASAIFLVALRLTGSEITFKQTLSTLLYGMMPLAVKALAMIPVALSRAEVDFMALQAQTLVASNLAAFAPEDAGAVLMALLSSVDVFAIWAFVLLVIGYGIVGRISKSSSTIVVGLIWCFGIALKVGLAALQG